MEKKQKLFYLEESNLIILKKLQEELKLSSGSQVINYLLKQAAEQPAMEEKIAIAVRKELEENYLSKERIRWGVQTAEQNSMVILDVLNTLLHKEKLSTCIDVDFAPSPVIEQSKERIKRRIHYFKQKSDERKSKGQS
mgnify:CR=1 FL=1|jgi:hypothetical protein